MKQPLPINENWLISGELPPTFALLEELLQPVVPQMQASLARIVKEQFQTVIDEQAAAGGSRDDLASMKETLRFLNKMFKRRPFAAVLSTAFTEGIVRADFEADALIGLAQIVTCFHIKKKSAAASDETKTSISKSARRVKHKR